MFGATRRVHLITVMVGTLLLFFVLTGVNTVFAANDHNVDLRTDAGLVQSDNNSTLFQDVAGFLSSLVTPSDACAATVVLTCKEYCNHWIITNGGAGYPCCDNWAGNVPPECETAWGCNQ